MTPEEQSIERAKEICEADGEALAKYYEENWDADKIRDMAQGQTLTNDTIERMKRDDPEFRRYI